jgi:formylglycine-generating enzyme required for sulfatase activity
MAAKPSDGPGLPSDALPERFGPYHIVQRLGKGGMGTVYLARDTRLDRPVALKVCHLSNQPQALERFRREAKAAAALRHPNLCPVYEYDVRDGIPYLVMAYIEGPTLAERLGERGPLPQREAALLVRQLALAMHEAHSHGVIHRDLKPSNVAIDERGQPVILDFGLARQGAGARLTHTGATLGTPDYMAPEQVRGDTAAIGPACDVYSLGIILYELLTGEVPFQGPLPALLGQALYAEPPPPSQLRPDLDPRLEAVCLRALAKDPAQRHADMAAFAAALEQAAPGGDASRSPTAASPAPPEPRTTIPVPDKGGGGTPTVRPREHRPDRLKRATVALQQPPTTPGERPSWPRGFAVPLVVGGATLVLVTGCIFGWLLFGGGLVVGEHRPRSNVTTRAALLSAANATGQERPSSEPKPPSPASHLKEEITNSIGMRLVLVPAGQFRMGSPRTERDRDKDAEDEHLVEITHPFYMGVCEVTQAEYETVIGPPNPSYFSPGGGGKDKVKELDTRRFPVEYVSWDEATAFCRRLADLTEEKMARRAYRLPTEAEWEYACRGGASPSTSFHFGGSLSSQEANFNGSYPGGGGAARGAFLERTAAVGSYPPNAFGLRDMHGNVWEWCYDWYGRDYYKSSPVKDPQGPGSGTYRVSRGGAWNAEGWKCRTASRRDLKPSHKGNDVGFRVVYTFSP